MQALTAERAPDSRDRSAPIQPSSSSSPYLKILRFTYEQNKLYLIGAGMGQKPRTDPELWGIHGHLLGMFKDGEKTMVSQVIVPKVWQGDVKAHVRENDCFVRLPDLGFVVYMVINDTAFSMDYFPKDRLHVKEARGLPYFIESVIVNDLRKIGITFMSTGVHTSPSRKKQLSRVGITPMQKVGIGPWLTGLGRGIRDAAEAERARACQEANETG